MDIHVHLVAILLHAVVVAENPYGVPMSRDNNTVLTSSGWVRGFTQKVNDVELRTFLGIPYAKPPLRDLRFRRPKKIDPWREIKDATRKPPSCFQVIDTLFGRFRGVEMWNPNTEVSEDCLYLNIWAPVKRRRSKSNHQPLAVMVWIYGGGFYSGSSTLDIYDAEILASHTNVIVASMQYRVGPMGFFYLGHERAPGNVGLLDQAMALRWIKENIKNFGGDPNRITLFGESAGAVSVSFHLLSPISRDLFNNAIMQSGTAFCPWALQTHEMAMKRAVQLAKLCGCKSKKLDELMDCMIQVKAPLVSDSQWNETIISEYFDVPIGPVIDGFFFRKNPQQYLMERDYKKTSILLGSNKDEGSYFLLYGLKDIFFKLHNERSLTREEFIEALKMILDPSVPKLIMDAIVYEYEISQTRLSRGTYRDIMDDISGDYLFICPTNELANVYSYDNLDVYMYRFLHRSSVNPWPKWMGVMHGYEIEFIFGKPMDHRLNYTTHEKKLSKRMMKFWSNFAKTGNPNSERTNQTRHRWPKYENSRKEYLTLNAERELKVGTAPRTRQCAFWYKYIPMLQDHLKMTRQGARCGCSRTEQVSLTILAVQVIYFIFQ